MTDDPCSTAETTLVVAFAGLPGTGKSTLARRLARRMGAPLLDKDRVREALFGPDHVTASDAQNDHCCEVLYGTVDHLEALGARLILLDGRTYTRRAHVERLVAAVERPGRRLVLIECSAREDVVAERLARDAAARRHPAPDRDLDLHRRLGAAADPLEVPHLKLDTSTSSPATLERHCLAHLGLAVPPG